MKISYTLMICAIAGLTGCTERTEAVDKLNQNEARVGISTLVYPNTVPVNTDFVLNASIANVGAATLPSLGKNKTDQYRVGVSYHWRTMDDKVVVWDGVFNPLKKDMKKGDSQTIDLAVKAPAAPGRYILEIDVLQNSAFWFAGAGSQTARINVDVK